MRAVRLATQWTNPDTGRHHQIGDVVDLPPTAARQLVNAGLAAYDDTPATATTVDQAAGTATENTQTAEQAATKKAGK